MCTDSTICSVGVVAADAWCGCGALLTAQPELCEFGPTSTRLALPDKSQTHREAIRGDIVALKANLAVKCMHSFTLKTKLNVRHDVWLQVMRIYNLNLMLRM